MSPSIFKLVFKYYKIVNQLMMEGVDELSKALITLSQKILERNQLNTLTLAKLLLLDIDKVPFKSMFDRWGCKNFPSLRQALENYYLTSFQQHIKWDSHAVALYGDDFVETFIFILDLALKSGKNSYIEEILTMDQTYQETLLPFVKAVTERNAFVEKDQRDKKDDNLFDLLEQNEKLKRMCDEWIQKYQEVKGEYDELNVAHQKVSEQLHLLKQDHQLVNEIGGSGTVEEALEKIRKDFADYERLIEKLKKELEQKKLQLAQRQEENRTLQLNFKTIRSQQKAEQLERANQKIKVLEQSNTALKAQDEETKIGLQECREMLKERDSQMDALKIKVGQLQAQSQKFANIRKLHNQYREKIMKDYKDLRE